MNKRSYKRVHRPFWSYAIHRTEAWLEAMAERGMHLQSFNRLTSTFSFRAGKEASVTYRIHQTEQSTLPAKLREDGWESCYVNGKWEVLKNESYLPVEHTDVSRDGILLRNNRVRQAWLIFFLIVVTMAAIQLSLLTVMLTSPGNIETTVETSPMWLLTLVGFIVQAGILFSGIYTLFRIRDEKRVLSQDMAYKSEEDDHARAVHQRFVKSDVTQWRPGWMSSPDRLGSWIEQKADAGLYLVRVSGGGTRFHFSRGNTGSVACHVQFERTESPGSESLHMENGWVPVYKTKSHFLKWLIWIKPYDAKTETKPRFYTDYESQLASARELSVSRTWSLGLLVLLQLFVLSQTVLRLINRPESWSYGDSVMIVLLGFATMILVQDIVRCWRYYLRVRQLRTS